MHLFIRVLSRQKVGFHGSLKVDSRIQIWAERNRGSNAGFGLEDKPPLAGQGGTLGKEYVNQQSNKHHKQK